MKQLTVIFILCLGGIASGCATITTGTSQSITISTEKNVTGAKCELTDTKGGQWYVNNTPGTVSVHKGDGPMTVICRKDGYKPATLIVEESVAGATLGNILIGGGIGIFIDAMSGSAQRYPDQIIVWVEPEQWDSEQARMEWFKEKEAFEEKLAKQNEPIESAKSPIGN